MLNKHSCCFTCLLLSCSISFFLNIHILIKWNFWMFTNLLLVFIVLIQCIYWGADHLISSVISGVSSSLITEHFLWITSSRQRSSETPWICCGFPVCSCTWSGCVWLARPQRDATSNGYEEMHLSSFHTIHMNALISLMLRWIQQNLTGTSRSCIIPKYIERIRNYILHKENKTFLGNVFRTIK